MLSPFPPFGQLVHNFHSGFHLISILSELLCADVMLSGKVKLPNENGSSVTEALETVPLQFSDCIRIVSSYIQSFSFTAESGGIEGECLESEAKNGVHEEWTLPHLSSEGTRSVDDFSVCTENQNSINMHQPSALVRALGDATRSEGCVKRKDVSSNRLAMQRGLRTLQKYNGGGRSRDVRGKVVYDQFGEKVFINVDVTPSSTHAVCFLSFSSSFLSNF
jgi:hypothetical protein